MERLQEQLVLFSANGGICSAASHINEKRGSDKEGCVLGSLCLLPVLKSLLVNVRRMTEVALRRA